MRPTGFKGFRDKAISQNVRLLGCMGMPRKGVQRGKRVQQERLEEMSD
jgi:hypothetical protein